MVSLENVDTAPLLEASKERESSAFNSSVNEEVNGEVNGEEIKTDNGSKHTFDRLLTQDFKVTGDISNRAHEKLGGSFTTIDDFF